MSQSHLRQLHAALTQRGRKIVEHARGAGPLEVRGSAAWELRRYEGGPALLLDFADFGGMGEDLPLVESYACQVRGRSIGLYFSRVHRSRERWLPDLNSFVAAMDAVEVV